MPLPVNIEDLLNKRRIESNRIEFKSGWNPDKIYHTICAFATDFENIGGGYVIVGVEQDENGVARRPVKGISLESIDGILKDMVNYDAKISPTYMSKVSVEEIDGQTILVIWAPAGVNRPYCVSESVVAKKSVQKFYIRSKSSTIEAKGEILDQVRELANRIPFDERGNEAISINDISGVLVYEYLKSIGSKLTESFSSRPLSEVLDEMDLLTGPTENRLVKNCVAMMFCEHPERFFPVTQVDIVLFPEGSIENPDVMVEIPKIIGPIPEIISRTLSYLRTNVIKQKISKPTDSEKSRKVYNYPYQAFEEAVVNALYHRDYQEREPIEITIEPDHVDILSYAGPDRSISAAAIKEAKKLKARRYRNRRLGDFLKELDLTEGRATGIPTIQKSLRDNGSPAATIETDDDRTYFLITIPCHADMIAKPVEDEVRQADYPKQIEEELILLKKLFVQASMDDYQIYANSDDQELIQLGRLFAQVSAADTEEGIAILTDRLIQLVVMLYDNLWSGIRIRQNYRLLIRSLLSILLSLKICGEMTFKDLSAATYLKSVSDIKRKLIIPLLSKGYIELTNPDKPQSPKQGYRLTDDGLKLFKFEK